MCGVPAAAALVSRAGLLARVGPCRALLLLLDQVHEFLAAVDVGFLVGAR